MFVATINTPGYLPWDDEPPVFETAKEAWAYLADERQRQEESTEPEQYDVGDPDQFELSDELGDLRYLVSDEHTPGDPAEDIPLSADGTGSYIIHTPGRRNDDHDLGLVYSVSVIEHANYPHEPGRLYDCPACEAGCHCTPGHTECVFEGEHNGTAVAE